MKLNPHFTNKKLLLQRLTRTTLLVLAVLCALLPLAACHKAAEASAAITTEAPYEGYKVTQYNDLTGSQASFYTITTYNDKLIIIDGGWVGNEAQVRQVIAQHGNVVDAWILSHPHQDHIGAFNRIYADLQGITIGQIYDSPISYDRVKANGDKWDDIAIFDTYHNLTANADNITHLYRGDTFDLFGLTVEVFNAYDHYVIDHSQDLSNDGSLMLKVSSANKSMLFCSDIKEPMEETITELYKDQLQCDYIQAAHHGNWSFSEDFYALVKPSVVFFDSPAWIMQDAQYPAYDLKQYVEGIGAKVYDHTTTPNSVILD